MMRSPAPFKRRKTSSAASLIALTKAVLPGMRAGKKGHIVNFSSIGGLVSFPTTGYYHATKYAVEGLSESLAQEVSPLGIKALIVEPGAFRTDWAGRSIKQPALDLAYKKLETQKANFDAWAETTRGADFPDAQQKKAI
jgi:short-subunit dehydrogenase